MASNLPPKGMRDFLPHSKKTREYVKSKIKDTYIRYGFSQIETSEIENIENMLQSDGGDNTKLIFKILKRGEKLDISNIDDDYEENQLADLALRFDLTLPLSRFYANNRNDLPQIFKAFQMGYVFRAERPQKGRYRAFMQCDIDIIGDDTNLAEAELLLTVYQALTDVGLKGHRIIINDRRILKSITVAAGFDEKDFEDVAITLDKLDKIGQENVDKELLSKGYTEESVAKLANLNEEIHEMGIERIKDFSPAGYENIKQIIDAISFANSDLEIGFDHSLVRGMGYYTSTIYEIKYDKYGHSIGGGGRYDNMIGKLSGVQTPACGVSIGYERLVDILSEENLEIDEKDKIALLYDSDNPLGEVLKESNNLRDKFNVSVFVKKKKLKKQLDRFKEEGFSGFKFFGADEEIRYL